MATDNIALIRFVASYAEAGVGPDGLPLYKEVVRIIKSVPPLTEVDYIATEADFDNYPEPYRLFQKQQGAMKRMPDEGGFPLALWPVVTPVELAMLAARDIVTIEQLTRAERPDMPGDLKELVRRAKKMIELSDQLGKFERIIREKDGVIEVLTEQAKELRATIAAQDALINNLKLTRAA